MNEKNEKMIKFMPLILSCTMALGIFLGATLFSKKVTSPFISGKNSTFNEILTHIKNSYVDDINVDSLSDYGIEKMLQKLDPHTIFIPASDAEVVGAELHDGFDGIGVEFNIFNDSLFVVTALKGGPSESVGIKSGDIILKADSTILLGKELNNNQVFKSLRGPRGSIVKLSILRKGFKKPLYFTVKRDKIPTYSIDAAFIMDDRKTGYIKVDRFAETTYDEFKKHLSGLKKQGMQQLILDLRGNTGGYLDRATDIVDELVAGNEKIVYTRGKESSNNYAINAGKTGVFEEGKLVVLVDEGSASASEIVSGALQDFDRAIIVGRRTFGKGLVQQPIRLSDGSELRLTIARYYIPSGRSIQKPYELGKGEAYMEDIHNRYQSKEIFNKDSIKTSGRPKFKTKKGKIVYGGGGITPDVFVPIDTSYYTPFLAELFAKNAFRDFTTNYTISNGGQFKKMGFSAYQSNQSVEQEMLSAFKSFAKKKAEKYNEKDFSKTQKYIALNIKALVARNLWKENEKMGLSNEYYRILLREDPMIKAGLKSL
jgi:carboxyl-terminal processing protease